MNKHTSKKIKTTETNKTYVNSEVRAAMQAAAKRDWVGFAPSKHRMQVHDFLESGICTLQKTGAFCGDELSFSINDDEALTSKLCRE